MISIYSYSCPINYLRDYFNFRQDTDSTFSLSKWSKQAGFSGPFVMMDILKGKKKLVMNLASTIVHYIGLDVSEFTYFLALVAKSQSEVTEVKRMYDLLLTDLKPTTNQNFSEVRFKDGDLFSHWILTTILGATKLKNAKIDAKGLKAILREEVSEEIIELGLQYLIDQGLIIEEEDKIKRVYDRVSTFTDIKHSNVNNYYFQMADMAKKAIDVPLELREFQSFNMTITKEQIPLIKDIIRKCRSNLSSICVDEAEEVYQMNMFFFPLTNALSISQIQSKLLDSSNF